MRQKRISMSVLTPVIVFLFITLVFAFLTGGRILKGSNLKNLLDQVIPVVVAGCGMVFVIAQGGVDMTTGAIMGFSAAVSALVFKAMGGTSAALVVTVLIIIVISVGVGLINGVLLAVCKVNSFMTTLAMSIILRGLMAYVINVFGQASTRTLSVLNEFPVKVAILVVCLAFCVYLLEHNVFGRKCTAIGENELAVLTTGLPVNKIKILAFMISGLLAAVATLLSMAKQGGSTASMGSNFELNVMFAMFVGGISVTGGRTTKVINFVIGAFTITIMEVSLVLCGWSAGEIKQLVVGMVLLSLLLLSQQVRNKVIIIGKKVGKKPEIAEAS